MKAIFLLIVFVLIPLMIIPESFSACILDEETGKYMEPCQGLPTLPIPSLKQQILDNTPLHEIKCPNSDHVLTQRTLFPNSTLNIHSQDKSQTNYDSSPVPVQHQSSNCKSSP